MPPLPLRPLAGGWDQRLFGIGALRLGLIAIPVIAATNGYVVAQPARTSGEPDAGSRASFGLLPRHLSFARVRRRFGVATGSADRVALLGLRRGRRRDAGL